tara:strand:- start:226 stop:492 length:267 start_codon:yes stop_codon:yes gene_type:complete
MPDYAPPPHDGTSPEAWGGTARVAITLAVLNERLETIEEKIDAIHTSQARRSDDLEIRVRTIERWMYAVPAGILTAIVSIAITISDNT